MSNLTQQTVLTVNHWTETLFSFTCTRDPDFHFKNGQFTLVGIIADGKPLARAYSMVNADHEAALEFLSIKVPDGPLTSRLQYIVAGDTVRIGRKASGTLIVDHLLPGETLWLLSTGTGLAPFMSLIKDPEIYHRYQRIVLTHTCRLVDELAYQEYITQTLPQHAQIGEQVRQKLLYYPSVTREPFHHRGRITDLIDQGTLFADLGLPPFSVERDRLMLCGSPQMIKDTRGLLQGFGLTEASTKQAGHYVVERAFAA
jgi:ferredoxin/flavodoxin---NADP+ reductase